MNITEAATRLRSLDLAYATGLTYGVDHVDLTVPDVEALTYATTMLFVFAEALEETVTH